MTQPEDFDPVEDIREELAELEAVGRRRQRTVIDSPDGRQQLCALAQMVANAKSSLIGLATIIWAWPPTAG